MIRRSAVWGAWASATAAWMLWVPFYYRFPVWWGGVLLAAAGALATIGDREEGPPERPGVFAPILTAAAAAGAFLLLPTGIAAALAMLLLSLVLLQWGRRARRAAGGLRRIATVAVAQGIVVSACSWGFGTAHASTFVSFFDHWIGRALGLGVSAVGSTLFFRSGGEVEAMTPSWDQFGLVYVVLIVAGWLLCRWLRGESESWLRIGLAGVAGAFAYGIVRHVAILLAALDLGDPGLFWRPTITLVSFVPLLGLAATLRPANGRWVRPVPRRRPNRRSWIGGLLVLIGAASLCVGLYLQPPGGRPKGRVLFDEAHGDWESTSRAMDTEWYGMPSTYNYDSLFQWLSHFYEVGRITGSLDDETLAAGDVLVLKTPSIPYSEDEIDAIAAHVRSGGGLFVIGDHTNVFGTTSVLNPVLSRFGVALNYDATYDLRDGSFTVYRTAAFPLDPVMQHVERFEYLTSCTVDAHGPAYWPMRGGGIIVNQADYATRDFFSPERFALSSTFGVFGQAVAVPRGRGRVATFTDSTCFSNFSVHMDGYPPFFLGVVAYLQAGGTRLPIRPAALALCGVSFAGALVLFLRRRSPAWFATLLVVGVVGWCAASATVVGLHRRWYPLPEPRIPIPYVYFDLKDSEAAISPQPAAPASVGESEFFGTFFVWSQRVGLVPVLLERERPEPVAGRPYVLVNPSPGISDRVCKRIAEYVREGGGTLVLMGRPETDRPALARLLRFLDLEVDEGAAGGLVLDGGEVVEHEISPAMTLEVSAADRGAGRVVLVGNSVAFSDLSFGGTFTTPSDVQRRLYDVAFRLMAEAGAPRTSE